MTSANAPVDDLIAEGRRIGEAAEDANVALKLTGGVAVALRSPSALVEPLRRDYADIDLVGSRRAAGEIARLIARLGYEADEHFNAVQGDRRLLFFAPDGGHQIDVFLDRVDMCHHINLTDRLDTPGPTLELADLLLMKLQVIETNEKDYLDIVALTTDHPLAEDPTTGIELPYIMNLLSSDWGLWRTTTLVAQRTIDFADQLPGLPDPSVVGNRLGQFISEAETIPKSRAWKLRARIGERKRWYDLPEEAH